MKRINRRGQVTVEAALLWTFVIAAFVFLGFYLQRAAQGGLKSNADGLGTQFSATSGFSTHSNSKTHETATATDQTSCNDYLQQMADPKLVVPGTPAPAIANPCGAAAP